jgi:hypothetical protein
MATSRREMINGYPQPITRVPIYIADYGFYVRWVLRYLYQENGLIEEKRGHLRWLRYSNKQIPQLHAWLIRYYVERVRAAVSHSLSILLVSAVIISRSACARAHVRTRWQLLPSTIGTYALDVLSMQTHHPCIFSRTHFFQ